MNKDRITRRIRQGYLQNGTYKKIKREEYQKDLKTIEEFKGNPYDWETFWRSMFSKYNVVVFY